MIYQFQNKYIDLGAVTAINIFPTDGDGYLDDSIPAAQITKADYCKVEIYFAGCLKPVFEIDIQMNDFTIKEIQDLLATYMDGYEE